MFLFTDPRFSNLKLLADGRVICNLCDKLFANFKSAKQHTTSMHEAPEYFECRLCKKVLNNKPNFRGHINYSHQIRGKDLVGTYGKPIINYVP